VKNNDVVFARAAQGRCDAAARFATADASSLIEEAAFFEDLFLSNGRFDAGNHFYDNGITSTEFHEAGNDSKPPPTFGG